MALLNGRIKMKKEVDLESKPTSLPCFVFGTLFIIGLLRCQPVAAVSRECTAQMEVTSAQKSDQRRITCRVWFESGHGSAGMQGLVPRKGPETFLHANFIDDDQWSVTSTSPFDLSELGWESFVRVDNSTGQLVLGITVDASCQNEIDYQCYCGPAAGGEKDAFNVSEPFRAEGLAKRASVWFGTTTPQQKLWHEGVPANTFLGARCFALENLHTGSHMHWVIHRNDAEEDVDINDTRVYWKGQKETHRAKNPADLKSYVKSECDQRLQTSTLNFEVARTKGPIQLECSIRRATDTDLGKTHHIEASAKTPPIYVIMRVEEESTVVTFDHERRVLKCESLANPEPTYVWAWGRDPEREVHSSRGPEPSYFSLSTLPFAANFEDGDFFFCNVSNTVSGTVYRASVNFSQENMRGQVDAESLRQQAQSNDEYVAGVLSTALAVGALLVLVVLVGLLVAEQVAIRREEQAWSMAQEEQLSRTDVFWRRPLTGRSPHWLDEY